ncbi:MAG: FCD domain-containing protein [Elsteraceae bacterium]
MSKEPNRLQRDLADRILLLAREERFEIGQRLSEHRLSKALQVSRTPVRAALAHLRALGVADWSAGAGYSLAKPAEDVAVASPAAASDASDALLAEIARDHTASRLSDHASEADLMRRYNVPRPLLLRALSKMAEVGLAERSAGYGWRFPSIERSREVRRESYRFRMMLEPAGLLEPTFKVDPTWISAMRKAHQAAMTDEWRPGASVAFFEMNAAFHEGLAAASGNRFVLAAVQQHNRLRRLDNYDWVYGVERVVASSMEHLAILDNIERGDVEVASLLLRRHLSGAFQLSRPTSRG